MKRTTSHNHIQSWVFDCWWCRNCHWVMPSNYRGRWRQAGNTRGNMEWLSFLPISEYPFWCPCGNWTNIQTRRKIGPTSMACKSFVDKSIHLILVFFVCIGLLLVDMFLMFYFRFSFKSIVFSKQFLILQWSDNKPMSSTKNLYQDFVQSRRKSFILSGWCL